METDFKFKFLIFNFLDIWQASFRLLDANPSPVLQSALFLCFRVMLVRMRPESLTSVWLIMISEMVHIFRALEYELATDSEKCRCVAVVQFHIELAPRKKSE